jgi:hypothetical protein
MEGLSNWGPTNVYGTATLWPQEQLATISVHLLPHLLGGQQYGWWVTNAQTGKATQLGSFDTSFAGDGTQDVFLSKSLPIGANEIIVTVWHPGDSTKSPGVDRSVAGLISVPPAPTATATPSAPSSGPYASTVPTGIPGVITNPGHHPNYTGRVKAPVTIRTLPSTGGGPLVHA